MTGGPLALHRVLAAGSALLAAVAILLFSRHLPERVASHFDPGGSPDNFMNRGVFVIVMVLLASALPLSLWWLQVRLAGQKKTRIPDPAYWFDIERQAQTVGFLCMHAAVFSSGLSFFMTFIFWLTLQAHRQNPVTLDTQALWMALWIFLSLTGAWVYWLHQHFKSDRHR